MRAGLVVVGDVRLEDPPEVALVPWDDVIEALTPNRANHAFDVTVLPRGARCRWSIYDVHCCDAILKELTVCAVAITKEISGCLLPGKSLCDLLRGPGRGRVRGDGDVNQLASAMAEDHQDKENAEGHGGHRQEIDGGGAVQMISQKDPPGLVGVWRPSRQVPRDCSLTHIETKLQKFTMDPWRTPERVLFVHLSNECPDFI